MSLTIKSAGALLVVGLIMSPVASAFEDGDWLIRFGASTVSPDSNNHPVVEVDDATSLTFNFSYFLTNNWAVELLAAWPFEHDISLIGGPEVGDTSQLPPTLSIQYHFLPEAKFQPYIGAGLNYTLFFDESTSGPLDDSRLNLDDSIGVAWQAGVDIMLKDNWFLNADVRYIDIETDAKLDGADLGTVKIDPYVYGIHVGYRF